MKEPKEFERKEAFETELRLNISDLQIIANEFSHLFLEKNFQNKSQSETQLNPNTRETAKDGQMY